MSDGTDLDCSGVGVWESTGTRGGHFTAVQAFTDASGASLGTLTIDGNIDVSEDGQTCVADPQTTLTYRDANSAVIATITPFSGGDPITPVNGTRMAVGNPGVPEGTSVAATPAS